MGVKGRDGFLERVGPGSAVAIWYLCAIVGNNAGKAVLPVFPYPYTLSVMQFGMGALSVPAYLALRGRPLKPLAALTQRFFGRGMFLGVTAALSWLVLRQRFSVRTLAALVMTAAGVALSSVTEFQFSMLGFLAALTSSFAGALANTYQKRFMHKAKGGGGGSSLAECGLALPGAPEAASLDQNELFFLTNLFSLALMLPFWWYIDSALFASLFASPASAARAAAAAASLRDGASLPAAAATAALRPAPDLVTWLMVLGNTAPNVLQHFASLAVLSLISPVSHAIVNSLKRIVVIGLSVLQFRNPVGPLNSFGMAAAFAGVYMYQQSLAAHKETYADAPLSPSSLSSSSSPLPSSSSLSSSSNLSGLTAAAFGPAAPPPPPPPVHGATGHGAFGARGPPLVRAGSYLGSDGGGGAGDFGGGKYNDDDDDDYGDGGFGGSSHAPLSLEPAGHPGSAHRHGGGGGYGVDRPLFHRGGSNSGSSNGDVGLRYAGP